MTVDAPLQLTALERELLLRFWLRYRSYGFPHPDNISVRSRTHTGAGRLTYLQHPGLFNYGNVRLFSGESNNFDMSNLNHGAHFFIEVIDKKISLLNIIVYGDELWDGFEGSWEVSD
jgi:hypothetical protein